MSALPPATLKGIVTCMKDFGDTFMERNENELFDKINSFGELFSRIISELQALPEGQVYRVVEFGCGDESFMSMMVHSLGKLHKRKVHYLGIDSNQRAIESLNRFKGCAPVEFRASCEFLAADASKLDWYKNLHERIQFHAAIFINPIVEDPFATDRDCPMLYALEDPEWVESVRKQNKPLASQHTQFRTIFTDVLRECLQPNAALLIRTFQRREYSAMLQILQKLAIELPENRQPAPDKCLAVTFKTIDTK